MGFISSATDACFQQSHICLALFEQISPKLVHLITRHTDLFTYIHHVAFRQHCRLLALWASSADGPTRHPKAQPLRKYVLSPSSTTSRINALSADLGGHALSMGAFGFVGYWAYRWDERAGVLLAAKRAEIQEHRRALQATAGADAE